MITEWFFSIGTTVVAWFWSIWPNWEVPSWLTGFAGQVDQLLSAVNGVAVWAPWTLILAVVGVSIATWIACLLVKYGRAVASYLPFIGGAG